MGANGELKSKLALPRLFLLDFLRVLALIQITAYHQSNSALPSGYLAVATFFALSTYLLFRSYLWQRYLMKQQLLFHYYTANDFSLPKPDFAATAWSGRKLAKELFSRLTKLYFPFLTMMVLVVASMLILYPAFLAGQVDLLRSAVLSYNNWQQLFNGVSYFRGAGFLRPFTHIWALSMEWQIYILLFFVFIPLYQLLAKKQFMRLNLFLALLATLGMAVVGFLPTWQEGAYFNTFLRFAPFAVGIVAACSLTAFEFSLQRKLLSLATLRRHLQTATPPVYQRTYYKVQSDEAIVQLQAQVRRLEQTLASFSANYRLKIYVAAALATLILICLPFAAHNLQAAYTWQFTIFTLATVIFIVAATYISLLTAVKAALAETEEKTAASTGLKELIKSKLVLLSTFAYFVYLWHYPVRSILEKLLANSSVSLLVYNSGSLLLTLILATFAYLLDKYFTRVLRSLTLKSLISALLALLLFFFPYQLFGQRGQDNLEEIKNKISSYEANKGLPSSLQPALNGAVPTESRTDNENVSATTAGAAAADGSHESATELAANAEGTYPLTNNTVNDEDAAYLALFEKKMAKRMANDANFQVDLAKFENIRLGKYTLLGDSIGVFLSYFYKYYFPNMNLDVKSVRQISTAKGIFATNLAAGQVGDPVIFLFGTNGNVTTDDLNELYESVHAAKKKMLLATVVLPWLDQESANNKAIRDFAATKDDVYLIDWHQAAKTHSEYFESDNIHPSSEGCEVFMHLIAKALTEALS